MKPLHFLFLLFSASAFAQTAILPPGQTWNGVSRRLIVPANDPWITPAEKSGFRTTPRYDETVAWLRKLVAAAPQLQMMSLGKSAEGRDIWMVIASKDRKFTPEDLEKSGRPVVLAQSGIHAGEMDGKDAGMMLLRDMTVRGTKRELLDLANFLFVPILNVDGHERFGEFTRINQRGPAEAGWRTNSRNLNLNRDYMKVDSPEARTIVGALARWDPDLYLDLHVTDGADYQYDITFVDNGPSGWSPAIHTWIENTLFAAFEKDLGAAGHIPGLFVWFIDETDPSKGIQLGPSDPRFSTGYGDARNIATVLVENHSLKPYDQRVLGTYVLLESALRTAGRSREGLSRAIESDRSRRAPELALAWKAPESGHEQMDFLGIEQRLRPSPITGAPVIEYTGKPITVKLPIVLSTEVTKRVTRPRAYWIPPAWKEVIERLAIHGVQMERIHSPREVDVEMYRLENPTIATTVFEGHVRVTATERPERRRERFPAGSVRVSTDQPLGNVAVLLLEPGSPDSLFQWGFIRGPLQRTEYAEGYIMAPMAERMLDADPALAAEFKKRLEEDPDFRNSDSARLDFFYRRTPYFDERYLLYPIARER